MQERVESLANRFQIYFVGNEPEWSPIKSLAQNIPLGSNLYHPLVKHPRLVTNKIKYPQEVRLSLSPIKGEPDHTYIPLSDKVLFQYKTAQQIAREYQEVLGFFPAIGSAYFAGDRTCCFMVTPTEFVRVVTRHPREFLLPNPGMLWAASAERDAHLEKGECIFVSHDIAFKHRINNESGFEFLAASELAQL